jgi:hypothetical protein
METEGCYTKEFFRTFGDAVAEFQHPGSGRRALCRSDYAKAREIEIRPTVHGSFDQPEPSQQHPEQSRRGDKPRLRMLPFQDSELLPKSQIFQQKVVARAKESGNQNRQEP